MKKLIAAFTMLSLSICLTGCGENTSIESIALSNSISQGITPESKLSESTALPEEFENTQSSYDTTLKVYVVDKQYMEFHWSFSDNVVFDTSVLTPEQLNDSYFPKVTLTFSCGNEKSSDDIFGLDCCYYTDETNITLSPALKDFFDKSRIVFNCKETAECNVSNDMKNNTLIFRIKAPDGSSLDFTEYKWFSTKIRFGYDETNAVKKEYTADEVLTDYSLNPYPDENYIQVPPENLPQEVLFDGQSFVTESKYYVAAKFEVPEVRVFDYFWFYYEPWDTWFFEARDERLSSIIEYQLISYDKNGNVLNTETRTIFPSLEDLLSSFRSSIGTSLSVKDPNIATDENRLSALYSYYSEYCPNISSSGNTIYNGQFFNENIDYKDNNNLKVFNPDSSGYAYESVPYEFQVEGGFINSESLMKVTVYYSDKSIFPKN